MPDFMLSRMRAHLDAGSHTVDSAGPRSLHGAEATRLHKVQETAMSQDAYTLFRLYITPCAEYLQTSYLNFKPVSSGP